MLIWARAKKDELIYSFTLILGLSSIFITFTVNFQVGVAMFLASFALLALAIIWNE